MQSCATPTCPYPVITPGLRFCENCRRYAREKGKRWLAKGTFKVKRYLKKRRNANRRAERAWRRQNQDRISENRELQKQLAKGDIIRPGNCQDCQKPCKPVAYRDPTTLDRLAWTCWKCYWLRKLAVPHSLVPGTGPGQSGQSRTV